MKQQKKGQGLSLEVIIVAVLVLLVLVVIGFIFMTQSNKFNKGINQCNGVCSPTVMCPDVVSIGAKMDGCKDSNGNTGSYCCPPSTNK